MTVLGSLINGLFLANYGLKQSGNSLIVGTDWRLLICWIVLYPLLWVVISQYFLPTKLTASVFDLNLGTVVVLFAIYIQSGMTGLGWLLVFIYGLLLPYQGWLYNLNAPSMFGLGSSGDSYFYSSFLLKGKTIPDVQKAYHDPYYVDWLGFEPFTELPKSSESFRGKSRFFALTTPVILKIRHICILQRSCRCNASSNRFV